MAGIQLHCRVAGCEHCQRRSHLLILQDKMWLSKAPFSAQETPRARLLFRTLCAARIFPRSLPARVQKKYTQCLEVTPSMNVTWGLHLCPVAVKGSHSHCGHVLVGCINSIDFGLKAIWGLSKWLSGENACPANIKTSVQISRTYINPGSAWGSVLNSSLSKWRQGIPDQVGQSARLAKSANSDLRDPISMNEVGELF